MSTEQNKTIIRRFFEEVHNSGKIDRLDELMVADYVNHDPSLPPELRHGRDAHRQLVLVFRGAFPDARGTIEDMIAEGDKVAARGTFRGTHRGELMGIPPTGKQVAFTWVHIYRIADGKLVEQWSVFDQMGLMQQLGMVPPEGA